MVKLKNGTRTCNCRITTEEQSLGPDYQREILLLDTQGNPVSQIQCVRGLENHPYRGTDPGIQRALNLIRRTNTRHPPDKMSSSDEVGKLANDEGPCYGFDSSLPTEPEEDGELEEEDLPEFKRILAITRGLAPPESPPRRRSTTRNHLLDEEEAPTEIQAGVPTQGTPLPPQPSTSSEDEVSPMRFEMRSGKILTRAPAKKKRGPQERR